MNAAIRVWFDTDIGTDVDDVLALGVLWGSPEVELLGVTTAYGDTTLRARLTARYARLAGRSVEVHAGLEPTRSGKPVWWAGHEGSLHEELESETFSTEGGVDALVRTVLGAPGTVDVIAVGPLANIAAAIDADPRFAPAVRRLWLMGGAFGASGENEHNIRSDVDAARVVFDARIPTTISGLEVTRSVLIHAEQLARISAAGPFGAAVGNDVRQWWEYWNEEWNVPHDPVTVLSLVRPDLITTSPLGRVTVASSSDEDADGVTTFVDDPDGWIRVVTDLDLPAIGEEITARVIAAQR